MNTKIHHSPFTIHDSESICFHLLFLAFLIFLLPTVSFFQPPKESPPNSNNFHQWGAVTLFNGLPSDNVRAITQTPDGILWFGTDNGLARFDGRRVQMIPLENPKANRILALANGNGNEIWIGTNSGALLLENGKFSAIPETLGKPITAILTGEKTVLISNNDLFFAERNSDNSLKITSESKEMQFVTVERNYDASFIFGSRGRGLIIQANNELQEVSSIPRPFFINTLKRDVNGDLWLGAQSDRGAGGLFYAKDIFRPVRTGENVGTITAIETVKNGDLWIGTEENGLFRFHGTQQIENFTFENTAGGLRSNKIYTIYADRDGVLWLGTNRGVCRFDASSPFNQTVSENANANFVRTIYRAANGQFYAGTNRGLFIFENGSWSAALNFPSKPVYTIAEDAAKRLIIGTADGLYGLDGKQISAGNIRAIVNFRGKIYTAIFGRGVSEITNQDAVVGDDSPTTLYADNEKLWIGTAKNSVFSFDDNHIKQESAFEILRGSVIRKITRDTDNSLWISGERGIYRFANNELQPVVENQDVRDFTIANKDVWAATLKGGLFHLRYDDVFGWISSDINVEQGLPSEQIFSILWAENRLLIGTNRGIVNYVPSAIPPQIVATRVLSQQLHSADELLGKINLDYPQNSLLIEVAGLSSRTFPEQFQYSFLLKNSKGEIIDKKLSNEPQFSPINLAPGDYKIEARSYNKDLLVSEPLTVNFSVPRAPFPWTATALGILLAFALVALIWAIIERRRIAQKNIELAAARFDLANEAERERKRIAQDLHDQTLADLRNLMLKSDKLSTDTGNFRTEIEAVSIEIRRICEDLSPSVLENVGLAPALEFLLNNTIENHKFIADENLEEELNFSPNVQMQIYRIAQEVLNNIKRHSDAKFVEMKIENSTEKGFILTIEDNGTFFDGNEAVSKNRGINNIKSRVSLIQAEADWQKAQENGTIFQLRKLQTQ
jgi:ligand-binding sensor domain-containing protein/two-component sensor histidine kinase